MRVKSVKVLMLTWVWTVDASPKSYLRLLLIAPGGTRNVYKPGFFFDKGENASQLAEIVNGVYGADTITANYVQFWFRRFRSGTFDVKDAPRTGRPVVENVNKITEIIEVDWHVSSSVAQELKINHKIVLNHLRKIDSKRSSMFGCNTN
ncbi:histone-lysine N-methyltransferase SETMAR [Trichonephila clavipes]|uniref:Histone-lysine N-methyltransferase SETMAR n=1 Tax=Trichonephila clavipes TaxID=2585209 RepID=A0A8X6SER8_TRICX|nr:histone-lysine N-methyltransferase SETMAR [Trichonephila clavipes]